MLQRCTFFVCFKNANSLSPFASNIHINNLIVLAVHIIYFQICDNKFWSMETDPKKDKNKAENKVYVKPVLNYNQIVEMIDNRIEEIEKVSEEIKDKGSKKNKENKKKL